MSLLLESSSDSPRVTQSSRVSLPHPQVCYYLNSHLKRRIFHFCRRSKILNVKIYSISPFSPPSDLFVVLIRMGGREMNWKIHTETKWIYTMVQCLSLGPSHVRKASWSFRETEEIQPQRESEGLSEGRCLHRVLRSFAVSYVIKFSFSTPSRDFSEDITSLDLWIRLVFLLMVTPSRNGS